MVSILLPCVQELRHGYLPRILHNLTTQTGNWEIVAAVSPSTDGTAELLATYPQVRVLPGLARNRAQRLNAALAASTGEYVLLHHPATLLPEKTAIAEIERLLANYVWGAFRHRFDLEHGLLAFTSWYANEIRFRRGIVYFDHGVFVRRVALVQVGGVPDLDIFEDTALSDRLRRLGPPAQSPLTVITSARRFRQRGIYRQALLNQALKLCYHLRVDPLVLNRWYEQSFPINVQYEDAP
ncbi:MAG TPA: glycosyl transferase [Cyanobacteria bacterium UBA8156]|nr:glycosyl transferase [Cyanobacteria bacterium UBA8156]